MVLWCALILQNNSIKPAIVLMDSVLCNATFNIVYFYEN